MKQFCIFTFLLTFSTGIIGQNFEKVNVTYQKIGEGLYDFFIENPNHYPVQLNFLFTEFENMMASVDLPLNRTVMPGKHPLLNIRRIYLDLQGSFRYSFQTRVGAYPVNYQQETMYQLPISTGKSTKLVRLVTTAADDPRQIVKVFSFQAGDTVFACREGIVCMKTETVYRDGFRTGENALTLLQPDLSFAKYEVFADSQLFVSLGDTISMGAPLGIAGGANYAIGSHNRFSVYYVNAPIDSILNSKLRHYHTFVDPLFQTGQGKADKLLDGHEYSR